ncbi:sulfate ABC transporter substrate-binding protein [Lapillicoccus sp.]|jgi:sulfate/thiosulfate-binding protein|uniref:sulfate ABC transporter substrate-binding protein n=1 Tax=Lapillicoccus sp. TaxID=1909287 RepID=UPI0025CF30BF|nr:sulfate ABC transporter substrate-binding protein [Lapillicoccus sp.]
MIRTLRTLRHAAVVLATVASLTAMAACSGGASDTVKGAAATVVPAADGSGGSINLYAFSVPKAGFDVLIPAFNATPAGKGVAFQASYGASGDQSRKVAAGAAADFVNFSVQPDMTRLVDAGLVDKSWNAGANKGIPFGSVVAIVVRKGNPKGITSWDDLLKPGVEVVTPNPFSSGSAKWNLLAPYADKSDGGKNPQAGLDYLTKLIGQHVKVQPKSGREASDTFLQGEGDVLLSYENEALFLERDGDPVEHFIPSTTFKIENPAAVVSKGKNAKVAQAFDDYIYTPAAQTLLAKAGFRVVDPTVAATFASSFPTPAKEYTIDDLGGWKTVDGTLFKKDVGTIAKIYDAATK